VLGGPWLERPGLGVGLLGEQKSARLADQVHRSRNDDLANRRLLPDMPFGKFDGLADGFGLHRESSGNAGRGQQIVEGSGAGGMDWREDDLVKNRKEDLCHLRDRFIAQATEDEGARR